MDPHLFDAKLSHAAIPPSARLRHRPRPMPHCRTCYIVVLRNLGLKRLPTPSFSSTYCQINLHLTGRLSLHVRRLVIQMKNAHGSSTATKLREPLRILANYVKSTPQSLSSPKPLQQLAPITPCSQRMVSSIPNLRTLSCWIQLRTPRSTAPSSTRHLWSQDFGIQFLVAQVRFFGRISSISSLTEGVDAAQYVILQRVVQDSSTSSASSSTIFSAMYRFCYTSSWSHPHIQFPASPLPVEPTTPPKMDFSFDSLLPIEGDDFTDMMAFQKHPTYFDLNSYMGSDWSSPSPPESVYSSPVECNRLIPGVMNESEHSSLLSTSPSFPMDEGPNYVSILFLPVPSLLITPPGILTLPCKSNVHHIFYHYPSSIRSSCLNLPPNILDNHLYFQRAVSVSLTQIIYIPTPAHPYFHHLTSPSLH